MDYKEITLETFFIVGIAVRTTNKNGYSQEDIGNLWTRFISHDIRELIPNKLSYDIYCVYTDYESDFMGEYTTIIGCKVSSIENLHEGLIAKEIAASDYRLYCSQGKIPECLGKTWVDIWQSSDSDRKYAADFDIYGIDAEDPDDAKVYTYLSVK